MTAEESAALSEGSARSPATVDRVDLHGWALMNLPPPSVKTARSSVLNLNLGVVLSLVATKVVGKAVSELSMLLMLLLRLQAYLVALA